MKKIFLILLLLSVFILDVNALDENRKEVKLVKCEDSLASWVILDGKKVRIKLIATDTSDGSLNEEIDSYVCNLMNNAKLIEIEFDPNYTMKDDYNRYNVWVYIDSVLLQEKLIEKGYAQVNYIKGEYLYLDNLCAKQKDAIKEKLGIWNYPNQEEKYCQSGIKINSTTSNEIEEKQSIDKKDYTYLYDMICLILFIITLSLIIKFKRSKNG